MAGDDSTTAARPDVVGAGGLRRAAGWALWALYLALMVPTLAVQAAEGWLFGTLFSIGEAVVLVLFATAGLLILLRQSRNRIAWIFLCMPLGVTLERAAGAYTLVHVPSQPVGLLDQLAVWAAGSFVPSGISILLLFVHLPLLYPDGRPPSPRWRRLLWGMTLLWMLQAVSFATHPGPFDQPFDRFVNPFPWEAGRGASVLVNTAGEFTLPLILLGSVASLVARWRRSTGVERQQLKWFLYAVSLLFVVMVVTSLVAPQITDTTNDELAGLLFLTAISVLPIALGVAVLRHRLYEIDRIISRTVSYVVVAVVLVAVYVGGVLALSSVAVAVTGESGEFVVALSTLLVAAVFQPVRRRVQAVVESRFDRRRYDARTTLDEFGRSLRDQFDTEALAASLVGAAATSLQPTSVSVQLVGRRP